jgi:hypothetical protein
MAESKPRPRNRPVHERAVVLLCALQTALYDLVDELEADPDYDPEEDSGCLLWDVRGCLYNVNGSLDLLSGPMIGPLKTMEPLVKALLDLGAFDPEKAQEWFYCGRFDAPAAPPTVPAEPAESPTPVPVNSSSSARSLRDKFRWQSEG